MTYSAMWRLCGSAAVWMDEKAATGQMRKIGFPDPFIDLPAPPPTTPRPVTVVTAVKNTRELVSERRVERASFLITLSGFKKDFGNFLLFIYTDGIAIRVVFATFFGTSKIKMRDILEIEWRISRYFMWVGIYIIYRMIRISRHEKRVANTLQSSSFLVFSKHVLCNSDNRFDPVWRL